MLCPTCKLREKAEGRARCFECMEAAVRAVSMPRYPHTTTEPVNRDRFSMNANAAKKRNAQ